MKPSPPPDFERLFRAMPGKVLALSPGTYEILAVTDAYLEATLTRESDLLGRTIFEAFPDDPDEPHADGERSLMASLRRAESLKTADVMGIQRHPIPLADGTFEERFWSPVNSPVLNEAGEVELIMHRAEDVTDVVRESASSPPRTVADLDDPSAVQDILLRSRDLRQALARSQENEARLQVAERLLGLGAWEYNLKTQQLAWSPRVHAMYGVPEDQPAPDLDTYFALVHPDDRAASRAVYDTFAKENSPSLEFAHRVVGGDGEVRHVRGIGERYRSPYSSQDELVVGYVQDITEFVAVQDQLSQAEKLLRLAGQKAHLGGWRVELDGEVMLWTPGTAAIHGLPADYSPSDVSEAAGYFAPEYRELFLEALKRCAVHGEEFDIVCHLQPPDGRQPWVRVLGAPERDRDGTIFALQGGFQDISTMHEAQMRAARAERERLGVLESISDAFFTLDEEWKFTYLNPQASVLMDMPSSELLGRNVWDVFPDWSDSVFHRQYRSALESKQTAQFQVHLPEINKWLDVSAYPVPEGLAVYLRDVTSEREQLEQLRLIGAALARQNDIVIITEADPIDQPHGPRIVYVNDAFERLTGYTRDEVIGLTPHILQGAGTDRQELDRVRSALLNKEPIRCELLNYSKTGDSYWLELDITPLFDEVGTCTHFVAVERDITQRKQQDEELRQAQERFQLISRATSDVIWDWDLIDDRFWWNDSMTSVFGYAKEELEPGPESWTSRIHPEDKVYVLRSIRGVIESEEEFWSCEYRFIRSDGESADVIDRGFVIRDDDGVAIRMAGSMLDITERKHMEHQLRESQKLEAVGHLTGGVAHDFNNLLTVILGNAEMLAELVTDPQLQPMAEMTVSAARRGAELTSRLLAFARRKPLDPRATDINQLVEAMRALFQRTLPENIELEFVPDPDLGIVEIDASELDTALLNLVVNARDAMRNGGKLTIETANVVLDSDYADRHVEVSPGEYVMVCVSDTGVGMDAVVARQAFEPFFTTKTVGKGSGLGLSMVYGFTKQSDGHIKIYSEPGEGTSVKLYFPRVRDAQRPAAQPVAEDVVQGGTEHILIAEDDDLVIKHLEGQLQSLGYRVTAVGSGPAALIALQACDDIDLLLTDIIMPGGMNGRELAERAQAAQPGLKVLFTSGYTENAIVHHGRLDAGVALLSKPYTRLELATKVRLVLDREPEPEG